MDGHDRDDDEILPAPGVRYRPWGAPSARPDRPAPDAVGPSGIHPDTSGPGVPARSPAAEPPRYPTAPDHARYPAMHRVEYIVERPTRGVSGMGLASFVLGILSFLIPWFGLLSLLAVVFGALGREPSRVGRGSSDGFAVAGMVLGVTSFLVYLVLFRGMAFLFLFR